MRETLAILIILISLVGGSAAARQESAQDPLALFSAYQSGYLQVVAHSCFQLYSSTGIIATDFADGYINGETALYALEHNLLLHSVCVTTLIEIKTLTPEEDTVAHAEFDRLGTILDAQGDLLSAIEDVILTPTDENAAIVQAKREALERLLQSYTEVQN